MNTFAGLLASDYVRGLEMDSWLISQDIRKNKAEGMTGADLVPSSEHRKLVCMAVAQNDVTAYCFLYDSTPFIEVERMHKLQRAVMWEDPREKKRKQQEQEQGRKKGR